jgi:release factor glutamine methyltransferase
MLPTVRALTTHLVKTLASTIRPLDQRWFEAELLVGFVLGQDRMWVTLHPDVILTTKQLTTILELAERRIAHEPLAYLFKQAPFFGRLFLVDKRVLIPRPESEQLVELALDQVGAGTTWAAWDVGTGSGCLALSVAAAVPTLPVIASDRSTGALEVAKKNAKRLSLTNVTFTSGSLLTPSVKRWLRRHQEKRWLILANLPYLPLADQPKMHTQVTDYEPLSALFAEDEGLHLINDLLEQLNAFLIGRTGDVILLEHDPRQAAKLARYAKTLFPEARITTELDHNTAKRFTRIEA